MTECNLQYIFTSLAMLGRGKIGKSYWNRQLDASECWYQVSGSGVNRDISRFDRWLGPEQVERL